MFSVFTHLHVASLASITSTTWTCDDKENVLNYVCDVKLHNYKASATMIYRWRNTYSSLLWAVDNSHQSDGRLMVIPFIVTICW